MKKEIIEIQVKGTEDGVKDINKVNDSIKNTQKSAKQASNETDSLSKSALDGAKSFKIMGVSINGASKMLKVLKISLIATGIGAIVVAVGALAAAFLSTQKGVDKLNSVLTPLKEVLETVWGIAQKLGEGLFDIVKGDVTKGFDKMAGAVENLGDQMSEAYRRGEELHELQLRIRRSQIEEITAVTKLNIQRAKALQIAEDTTKTEKERRDGFKKAIDSENAIAAIRKAILTDRIKELELSQEANDTSSDEFKELVQLKADADQAEFDRLTRITALTKRLNTVKATGETETGETFDEFSKRMDDIQKGIEAEDTERIRVAEQRIKDNEDLQLFLEEQEQIETNAEDVRLQKEFELANKKRKLDEEEAARKKRLEDFKIQTAQQGFAALSAIAEEGSAGAKAIALAQAVLTTYLGINKAFAETTDFTPTQSLRWANAIAAGVSGFANVRKIISTDSKGKQTPSGVSPSRPQSQAQSPSFNIVGANVDNQLETAVGSQTQEPVKAYVVSSDVTTSQEMDRNIVESASL